MKPIETGGSDDAEQLQRAAGTQHPLELIRPVALPDPVAPLVAARRAGTQVDLRRLDQAFDTLCASSDVIVVEGAGGLLVPITESENFATLFRRWNLDLVIVAANKLGVVNHTLLTVETALQHGLTIQAIVLNTIHDGLQTVAESTNSALLSELLPSIPIHTFSFLRPIPPLLTPE
jgi:dethiobiotin synthetase